MTRGSAPADLNAPVRVLKYGLTVGAICAAAFLAQRAVWGATALDFDDIPLMKAIAICAGAGCLAGTVGGMFAVSAATNGKQTFATGMTGFCIVLAVSVAVVVLAEPGHVVLFDLEIALGLSVITGLAPLLIETRRREARGILVDRSDLLDAPPKPSGDKPEFDLS